jgi:hypothetical protein
MLIIAAVVVVLGGVVFAGWMLSRGRLGAGGFFAVVSALAIAGIAIANLPRVNSVAVEAGATNSLKVTLQETKDTAQQVQTDAGEVRQMKEQIEALLKRVEEGEQNVSRMRDSMQQTWRSLFESFAYIVDTRNLIPPPDFIADEIVRHINILGAFAYPNWQERADAIGKINENVEKAQAHTGSTK